MAKMKLSEWKAQYNLLLKELSREQCVLLIGPEILRVNGVCFQQKLQQELQQSLSEKIPFYYPKDALFVFKDDMSKAYVQGNVVDYLDEINTDTRVENKPDEAIFKKIAALPFHLIISVNPDHFLSDTFAKYGVRHRFAYFHHSGSGVADIEDPHDYMPLIYNLFGSKDKDASLVLDYDDLFNLLQTLLGKPGLPTKLDTKLKEAKSFLFLGFRFDRWYSQLLLRLLAGKQAIRKYAFEPPPDADTSAFLVRQMDITFLGSDLRHFEFLYKFCEDENRLRDLVEIQNPSARAIFQMMQIGDTGRAMKTVGDLFKGAPEEIEATQLQARFANWEKNQSLRLVSDGDAQIELNKIIYATLQLINAVK